MHTYLNAGERKLGKMTICAKCLQSLADVHSYVRDVVPSPIQVSPSYYYYHLDCAPIVLVEAYNKQNANKIIKLLESSFVEVDVEQRDNKVLLSPRTDYSFEDINRLKELARAYNNLITYAGFERS